MTDPYAMGVFLDRVAGELERLKNQTAIVSDPSASDLSPLLRALEKAISEAQKLAKREAERVSR